MNWIQAMAEEAKRIAAISARLATAEDAVPGQHIILRQKLVTNGGDGDMTVMGSNAKAVVSRVDELFVYYNLHSGLTDRTFERKCTLLEFANTSGELTHYYEVVIPV